MKHKTKHLYLLLLLVFIAVQLFSTAAFAVVDSTAGSVMIDKYATPTATPKLYDVTLTVKGDPVPAPIDAILVIDVSISMGGTQPNSLSYAQSAAISFATDVLSDPNSRVAIVSYSESSSLEIGFSNDLAAVTSAINGLLVGSYTNIAAGFNTAASHMNSQGRAWANKAIILLSDGVANSSPGNPSGPISPTTHNAHTLAAIAAGQAAQGYASVYTVGLFGSISGAVEALARDTLQQAVAPNAGNYFETESGADLASIYAIISAMLKNAGSNAIVVDVIEDEFELVPGSISVTQGSTAVAPSDTITWTLGSITSAGATMTYKITAKAAVPGGVLYDTNVYAELTYTNYLGEGQNMFFPIPEVIWHDAPVIQYGTITVVKDVINETDDPTEFEIVINNVFKLYVKDGSSASIILPLGTYNVVETPVAGYENISITPASFTLTTSGQTVTIVNSKDEPDPGASITINKVITDAPDDDTAFSVIVIGPNGFMETVNISQSAPAVLSGLEYGTYTLTEEAKEGYTTVSDIVFAMVLTNQAPDKSATYINAAVEIDIPDEETPGEEPELPQTGGLPPQSMFGLGGLLTLAGTSLLMIRRKKS